MLKKEVVLITGGSGMVGRRLTSLLAEEGYSVRVLSRKKVLVPGARIFLWDYRQGFIERAAIDGVDHIIHLAGESIANGRWSEARKSEIIDSRTRSASFLFDQFSKAGRRLLSFTSSSATGYYGAVTGSRIFTEEDAPGPGFAAATCIKWEEQARRFSRLAERVAIIRTGIVLSPSGGMLESLLPTIRMRFSPLFGDGNQWIPWIHIDDLCSIYHMAIKNSAFSGIYNAVSPLPVTYSRMVDAISAHMGIRVIKPATPGFIWKALFGEKSEILLTGSRVSSEKIAAAGYNFIFPQLEEALLSILADK